MHWTQEIANASAWEALNDRYRDQYSRQCAEVERDKARRRLAEAEEELRKLKK